MKNEIIHYGIVKDGKLVPDNPDFLKWDITNFEGATVEIKITAKRLTRSLLMNAYLWGAVYPPLVNYFNDQQTFNRKVDKDYVHSICKGMFIGWDNATMPDGTQIPIESRSAELDNQEFIAYFENIIAWSAEIFGLEIAKPNERLSKNIDYNI